MTSARNHPEDDLSRVEWSAMTGQLQLKDVMARDYNSQDWAQFDFITMWRTDVEFS